MLNMLKPFLKENGKVLLAIENKFGLKYWCGAAEDHTGIPFVRLITIRKARVLQIATKVQQAYVRFLRQN